MPKVKSLTYVCKLKHHFKFLPLLLKCYKNIFTSVKLAISLLEGQMMTVIHLRPCFIAGFGCLMTLDCFERSYLIVLLLYRINSWFKKNLLFSDLFQLPVPLFLFMLEETPSVLTHLKVNLFGTSKQNILEK